MKINYYLKYEFFITNAMKDFSHYLYFSPYTVLVLLGKEKENKYFSNINLNIKDSINLNKYSKYWGFINTLNKCMRIHHSNQKAYFDLSILEKDPQNFFYLKETEKNEINNENLNDFENKGFIRFKNNNDLEMTLLNCTLVEMQINQYRPDKRFFKISKNLLNILLSDEINNNTNLNSYISENIEELLIFNEDILSLKREEFELRRKAYKFDGTIKLDEDFVSDKHKTIFSYKNFIKLNDFKINSPNRYSKNQGMNKNLGGMNLFMSASIKRDGENNDKVNLGGLAVSWKKIQSLYKDEKIIRNRKKKFTIFERNINRKLSNLDNNIRRKKNKTNTNIIRVKIKEKEQEE